MEKFTNEFFNNLLSNATSMAEAIQIMRNIQTEIEQSDGKEEAEQFGEKFNSFILKNWSASKNNTNNAPTTFASPKHIDTTASLEDYSELLNHTYGEMDVAQLFGLLYKDNMHYVPEKKCYYIYNGKKWIPDTAHLQVNCYAKQFVKSVLSYLMEHEQENADNIFYYNSYLGFKKRANLIEDCKTVSPVFMDQFDRSSHLFNCKNGTLDLATGQFYAHRCDDLLSLMANVDYDQNATCERWEQFVSEIMDGDASCIEFLQMICGLFLTSYTDEQCFFLFYGIGGRNGKSTLCDTLLSLLGDYGNFIDCSSITNRANVGVTAPNEELAKLRGCRLVSINSSDEELTLDTKLIKNLLKHDSITARFPYQNSFEYEPKFKFIISTNYLPRINDSRIFASNQMILLPFPIHFSLSDGDASLRQFFCQPQNLSGIFNWCLEGLEKYMALRQTSSHGLKYYLPKKVKQYVEECRQEQDFSLVSAFIEQYVVKIDDISIEENTEAVAATPINETIHPAQSNDITSSDDTALSNDTALSEDAALNAQATQNNDRTRSLDVLASQTDNAVSDIETPQDGNTASDSVIPQAGDTASDGAIPQKDNAFPSASSSVIFDSYVSVKEVFHAYSKWCHQKDYRRCGYRSFVKELRKHKTLTRRSEGFVILQHRCIL